MRPFTFPGILTALATLASLSQGAVSITELRGLQDTTTTEDSNLNKLSNTTYTTVSEECNFFVKEGLTAQPWPENCQLFWRDDCSKYEISKDGKSIESCEVDKQCQADGKGTNKFDVCEGYYDEYSFADDEQIYYRFPETDKGCNFTEAKYPLKPWP